ncbi:hypothetical protein O3M35_006585 [Rhynocoris fuscipes]|uniref:Uncharacterized protein n=1 Tax=Rhynocoris fuscipes TaxID=488301 RepID=A0AAW1DFG3_9HEMI
MSTPSQLFVQVQPKVAHQVKSGIERDAGAGPPPESKRSVFAFINVEFQLPFGGPRLYYDKKRSQISSRNNSLKNKSVDRLEVIVEMSRCEDDDEVENDDEGGNNDEVEDNDECKNDELLVNELSIFFWF